MDGWKTSFLLGTRRNPIIDVGWCLAFTNMTWQMHTNAISHPSASKTCLRNSNSWSNCLCIRRSCSSWGAKMWSWIYFFCDFFGLDMMKSLDLKMEVKHQTTIRCFLEPDHFEQCSRCSRRWRLKRVRSKVRLGKVRLKWGCFPWW